MPSQLTLESALEPLIAAHQSWLDMARAYAKGYAIQAGSVTSDDVRRWADTMGCQPDSPHAWGALFLGKEWMWLGRQRSTYQSNNGRFISQWRWQP